MSHTAPYLSTQLVLYIVARCNTLHHIPHLLDSKQGTAMHMTITNHVGWCGYIPQPYHMHDNVYWLGHAHCAQDWCEQLFRAQHKTNVVT